MRIVTASLDDATFIIWKKLPHKSKWLRRQLALHGLKESVLVEHTGKPTEAWSLWEGDARCNPHSQCAQCWSDPYLEHLALLPAGTDKQKSLREFHESYV